MAININQIQSANISGGTSAIQLVSVGSGSKTVGNGITWAATGNVQDCGYVPARSGFHTEILTDGAGNLIFAAGDLVYVLNVSN